jgi:hypothetical protein
MRIDQTQRGWAMASLVILAVSAMVYVFFAGQAPRGATGGSPLGLLFGSIGFGFMIFAALLGARKRVPVWRIGRAQAWMRGHLWLGMLSLPLILFHGGFHFGGLLTEILMWLLIITVASGIFGATLQHYLPTIMTRDVPLETIYDEIGHVHSLLREEADRGMEAICGPLGFTKTSTEDSLRAGGFAAMRPIVPAGGRTESGTAVAAAAEVIVLSEEESAPLRRFYLQEMRPFLEDPKKRGQRLADAEKASAAFAGLRTLLPAPAADALLDDLMEICDETRQLVRQERLHHWLHNWLLVHIPLSLALILLGAIHAVVALRY